ncbi:MAG: superoxide dismutase [Cyclobacteriaceae bacterium]|nr:MAG: superoxide dismutase [Cyclobacteriaceae bacterium]
MKTSRRKFMSNSLKATVGAAVGSSLILENAFAHPIGVSGEAGIGAVFEFKQIPLPYEKNALEPSIDAMTMDIHYTKHHAAYIKNVNEAIVAEKLTYSSEKEFFDNASKLSAKVRNNAGGAWNHNFFWQVMKPGASGTPYGKIVAALDGSFGSVPKFMEQFNAAAMSRFGSGWAWLVKDANGKLQITSTPNQDNPLMDTAEVKGIPLLGLDVWEHAYYLKYQNKRNEYITNWWNVVNWDEVAKRLG